MNKKKWIKLGLTVLLAFSLTACGTKDSGNADQSNSAVTMTAEAFLEDCMAVVVDSKAAVMEYFEEAGIDVENPDQVLDEAEVFDVGDGRYLIVEG